MFFVWCDTSENNLVKLGLHITRLPAFESLYQVRVFAVIISVTTWRDQVPQIQTHINTVSM